LTALRMSQTPPHNDAKIRTTPKEVHGHPPRNPLNAQIPPRQPAAVAYPTPPIEPKSKHKSENSHSKTNKNKGRGRTSPVDASFGSMPHGLTVQELKELTRIRLAREAVTPYSSETSDYSDARTLTTSATFRSGYTVGDLDSYSDTGSAHRNRSTSTSPISNTDSESLEEGYARYAPYHPSIPNSPSSINRSERERQVPSYSPDRAYFNKSPLTSPSQAPSFQSHLQIPQKPFAGIHPGLQRKCSVTPPSIPAPRAVHHDFSLIDLEISTNPSSPAHQEDLSLHVLDTNVPILQSSLPQYVRSPALSHAERESSGTSLRKFVSFRPDFFLS
jgi:hypothetical protein